MRKSVYFMCIVLQGALSASLPASKNPYQDVDSFKDMQVDIQNQLTFGRHGAGVQLEDDTTELQDVETDVQDEVTELGDDVSEVQNAPQSITSYYVYNTMFSAYLSYHRCYHTGANIQFNIAPVNPNHRYNVHTGIYTVPYTGYYVFTWTVVARYKSWFSAELRANGVLKGTVMADSDVSGSTGGGIHPATGYVITHLTVNQHVYIRYVSGEGCGVKSDSRTRSTFSGWRLY